MGALLGGPAFPLTRGTRNGKHRKKIKEGELSIWAFNTGSCSEAPCGAAEENPDKQIAGGTPLIGEEHLSVRGG